MPGSQPMKTLRVAAVAAISFLAAVFVPAAGRAIQSTTSQEPSNVTTGVREAAWSPDGKRIAATWFDAIWTMAPDGKDPKKVVAAAQGWAAERDPVWSPDGKTIVFSASLNGEFDLWTVPSNGGLPKPMSFPQMAGDERWPSFTPSGALVFSHRPPKGTWRLVRFDSTGVTVLTQESESAWQGRVSPDGKLIAYVSDRDPEPNNDADVWVRELTAADATPARRVTRSAGIESHPAWAPDSKRVAYAAARQGAAGIYVGSSGVSSTAGSAGSAAPAGAQRGRGAGGAAVAVVPADVLASTRLGVPAWSPDGQTLLIATFATSTAPYNGNPNRNDNDPPTAMAGANQFALWRVLAPRAADEGAAQISVGAADSARWTAAFDQVWQTLKAMYYASGPSAASWDALRQKYRGRMAQVKDLAAAELVIDEMLAEQPPIKPAKGAARAVVASGHPLASQAGADVLAKGGNIVDAGVATAFALGVVEPEASGLGGDGQAILFLKGMSEPVVIEYKDMTPSRATADNPRLFTPAGARTAPDGPTVANIPGVVAGLDLLYRKYGSKKIAWADLIAPAVKLADEGFILDEALPTSIAEGRDSFVKYPEAAKIYLPNGRVPKPGDRFVNKDYAETLRILAKEGGDSFYRGSIARRIADDMAANGGVITFEDLAQYRAMERKPIVGRYRNHLVYSVPAPVPTGLQIVESLQILDNFMPRAGATYATNADYFHHAIEAWRVRDGGARIADPERYPVDYGNHLEPGHALERFKLIDPRKVFAGGGGRGGAAIGEGREESTAGREENEGREDRRVLTGTTSFVVADGEGNMIAFTQTLSTWGGNYYVSKGLGFLYNDHFRGGGGRGGGFGSTLPLMRSSSTSVPTLVFAPSSDATGAYGVSGFAPRLAVGCAGNAWIPASVYNIILNVIDGGLGAQPAIEAPRFLIGGGGGRSNVQIEDRIARTILADLESRGHTFTKVGRKGEVKYGYAAVAVVDAARSTVEGGAEPRRSHAVAIVR
jgi:gamma-glutamyltranspeptidase/glutathione hydrolase